VVGTVRIRRPVTSPLGMRCAVWQVRGRGPTGLLDDAGVGSFDVVRHGKILARVECDDALVDLGREDPWLPRQVDDGLAAFLRVRGAMAHTARVAETVLRDGDEVEVSGLVDDELVTDGRRGSGAAPRFGDWPSIRKV
jgi:hypothetical protein